MCKYIHVLNSLFYLQIVFVCLISNYDTLLSHITGYEYMYMMCQQSKVVQNAVHVHCMKRLLNVLCNIKDLFFLKFRCAPKLAKTAILIHMLYLLSYKYKFITVLVLVTFRNIGLFRMSVIIFFIRSIQSNKKCKYENSNYIRYFQYLIFIGLLVLKSINCV